VTLDDIYLGNGASELIVMATNALLDNGDDAAAGARLSAVDGRHQPVRRHAGALHVRRGQRLDARPGRHPRQDHAAHQGHRRHQPEQPHRRAVLRTSCCGHRRSRASTAFIFADEVYDKVLYDGVKHTAIGSLSTTC
jgi:alanine-synthesizing transaminase